jgi:two-component system sensor histidine kinase KdpD
MARGRLRESVAAVLAVGAIAALTAIYSRAGVSNATVPLSFLMVVLGVATVSTLRLAIATSVLAMASFNYFFLPPVGTLTIADPQNWVALLVFLAVSLVASNLSNTARARAAEAVARRDEMARLFDLSRDVLLTSDSSQAVRTLAQFIARRFSLDHVSICLPDGDSWRVYAAGPVPVAIDTASLSEALAGAGRALEFDARERTYGGHRVVGAGTAHPLRLVPLRIGDKAIGLLAAPVDGIEPGTLDALAGITAIAIERVSLLDEREAAEISRHREELKSALLASLAHDLKTPLTAIRVAADNLQAEWLTEAQRREQGELVLSEVERLARLFEGILDMARIDAGAVTTDRVWVHPLELVEAARTLVDRALKDHPVEITDRSTSSVYLDPRLTSAALARLLENAAAYSPAGSPIEVDVVTGADGLRLDVRDHGPGVTPSDIPNLFRRFFRGSAGTGAPGTGMGLAIARGLLAAEGGRVWVENHPTGGAMFTISVAAPTRHSVIEAEASA